MHQVYVVIASLQYKYELKQYHEIVGVSESPAGARKLEKAAKAREEVIDVDTELVEVTE